MKITEIDRNMLAESNLKFEPVWYDAKDRSKFRLFGLYRPYERDDYVRMDPDAAAATSKRVETLNRHLSGGRLCFTTDAGVVALHARRRDANIMFNMPWSGSASFALYVNDLYYGAFRSEPGAQEVLYQLSLPEGREKHVTIYFPLYGGAEEISVGLPEGAAAAPDDPADGRAPILYYGSSITQGGCASQPGNSYQGMIYRKNHIDFINLGFSGAAKGEAAMADWLAGMDTSLFVCDFDHNCNKPEDLAAVHEPLFRKFRAAHPDTPVILMSRTDPPRLHSEAFISSMREVVLSTYRAAKAAGDENVYFIDGAEIFGDAADLCTIEGCHPNDLGFYHFYKTLAPMIDKLLNR